MLTHIVMWNLKSGFSPEEKQRHKQKIKLMLEALPSQIEGLETLTVSFGLYPEGYDLALVSTLKNEKALDFYQDHPAHLQVKSYIRSVISERAVIDFLSAL